MMNFETTMINKSAVRDSGISNCPNVVEDISMCIYSIYRITNLVTSKIYIGFTSNPDKRWKEHLQGSTESNPSEILYKSMRKHGVGNFVFDVIYQSKDGLFTKNVMENYFIVEYNSYISSPNSVGYNMTLGGDGVIGYKFTEEQRNKISNAKIGKPRSNETRAKLSASKKGKPSPMKGRTQSIEARERIAAARKGKPSPTKGKVQTLEAKQKISASLKGNTRGAANKGKPKPKVACPHCNKLGGSNNMKRYHFDNCKRK